MAENARTQQMTARTVSMTALASSPVAASVARMRALRDDRTPSQVAAYEAEHARVSALLSPRR